MNKMVITNEELKVMKELLSREKNEKTEMAVPRIMALKLETMLLVKHFAGAPDDYFRLTELGKAAIEEMSKGE
jgi:hypothetical protein